MTPIFIRHPQSIRYLWWVARHLLLIAGAAIFTLPTFYMISASLMSSQELFAASTRLLPSAPQWSNYLEVFGRFNFARYLGNSLIVTAAVVALNLVLSPMVGYSLAKFDFPGKRVLFLFILATVMVPFTAILIPLFLIGVFLMRQFALAVPDDYLDAARIDGANEYRIFFQIVMPLLQPALITLAIIVFVAIWDEFLWMLVVTTGDSLRTLPIGLAKFVEQYTTRFELMMAGAVISAAPVVLVFLSIQQRFLQGMAGLSGLK
jgi:multiple sugar transport system permease protein